jgi:hypothetical protein
LFTRVIRRRRTRKTWIDENGLQVAGSFSQTDKGEVRAYVQPFKGRELAHIRHFIRGKDGLARPTKKGIAVDVAELPKLADAIAALLAIAEVGR